MLDDRVAGVAPLGGVQLRPRQTQLVDDADERARSQRRPDAQDSQADHPSSGLGDEDRRGGDVQEVAEEVGVPVPGSVIGLGIRHQSDGGVEISRSGGADENLHLGPQRGVCGRAIRSGCCWTTRRKDTTIGR